MKTNYRFSRTLIAAAALLAVNASLLLADALQENPDSLRFEAEELLYISDTSARTIQAESASGGEFVGIYPCSDGLGTSFYLDIQKAGEYEIRTLFAGGREANVQFEIDGEAVGDAFAVNHRQTVSHGTRQLNLGQVEIRYLILNSGTLWVDAIELRRRSGGE